MGYSWVTPRIRPRITSLGGTVGWLFMSSLTRPKVGFAKNRREEMSDTQRAARFSSNTVALAASTTILGLVGFAYGGVAQLVLSPTADAEIRETVPENTRGFGPTGVPSGGGQQGELQISSGVNGVSNRNLALIRFQLPAEIQTPADLQGFADLQFFFRSQFNSAATSFRVYGLNPAHPLNTTWDEQNVYYRDAGIHQNPNPVIGTGQSQATPSVLSQPNPGDVTLADPVAPITPAAGYGADPNSPRRAPGIRYEDAPFSQQVVDENNARFTFNQQQRAAFIAGQTFQAYLPYIAQPGYNVNTTTTLAVPNALTMAGGFTDIYSDVPESNRPFFSGTTNTYVDDLTADLSLLGFTTLPAGLRLPGDSFAFTTDRLGTVEDTSPAQLSINLANLVNFLSTGLTGGFRDFTFLLGPGIGADGDIINNTNQQVASKDIIGVGGVGAWAPRLLVAPEPGSAIAAGIACGLLSLRRRKA
jgi:hypothetical protein